LGVGDILRKVNAVPIAASGSGGSSLTLLFFILIPLGMYFLMIRPQQRRARELRQMQSALAPGAEVMTGSGIYGTVTEIDPQDDTVVLEISSEVHVRFARAAISRVLSAAPADDPGVAGDARPGDADEVDHPTDTDTQADEIIKRKD
jgi:preprotein translocase subunit YajC